DLLPEIAMQPRQKTMARRATTIILDAQPGLAGNPQALAAWSDAVALWESVLNDNVTITIKGDLQALPPGVLGSTSSSLWSAPHDFVRTQMVADAAFDETILSSLPTAAQLNYDLQNSPAGFSYAANITASKAVLRALGNDMSSDDPNPDGTITFSTLFLAQFDFDPTDGITPGKIDFFAVVVHEIGHALGFNSEVDTVDYFIDNTDSEFWPHTSWPYLLDLFRLAPGAGAANFTSATRILTAGNENAAQTFYDGITERRLSTGRSNGDGNQASHWRADEISGITIGIMDPTLSSGQMGKLTNSDLRLFGLIGWDVTLLDDCNGNDIGDQFDIWDGDSEDFNLNGVPDECEATDAPVNRFARVTIAPNPFNPRTEIRLELGQDASARIDVYDLAGRHIANLADRSYGAGEHSVIWEGKDATGRAVSSGVYFVMVDIDGEVQQHKVALVR
ncbi:hypothetical protein DRQ53_03905, partial [bacterium]